jgi:hypothetical protein
MKIWDSDVFRIRFARDLRGAHGLALIDCLAYIALLLLLLSLAFMAFYQTSDNSKHLSRNAADIVRVLNAGERWRTDIRSAVGQPTLTGTAKETILHLPQTKGEVLYAFREGTVLRQATTNASPIWESFLTDVKGSRMKMDQRLRVTTWRWEVELQAAQKVARVKPLFTFQAVPANSSKP